MSTELRNDSALNLNRWSSTCLMCYLQAHKWENAMTLDKGSWGFRRNMGISDFLTDQELITTLAKTVM
ncbi:hypothetical protein TNIN_46391 [Trichonephila inaurata madagascariensis]|uniref:Glycoside hydrolase family 29 N-terminal domain-containing protein n=1 Tax=Trichonephila inaurata madagascariensis TaxID=2747483 RepID=A0A8X6I2X2_9ARAC|nr:hypothetical protein TNIN_46391 [Trichonephila inaurata madagascariensis]